MVTEMMTSNNTGRLNLRGFSLLLFLTIGACALHAQTPNPIPKHRYPFIISAHRGDHTHAPENTLQAYANAIQAGADFVEIDLRTTRDSVLVIMHDVSVNRMTTGAGIVRDMSYDSLRLLRVSDKTHPEWGAYEIPTFEQVLKLCRGKIGIYLDFKDADVRAAYALIRQYGMEDQVIVYINAPGQFYAWRRVAPRMPLMVSLPRNVRSTDSLAGFLDKYHPDVLDGDWDEYAPEMVALAVKRGYLVFPDIQGPNENAALWDAAVNRGIHALQTDHPGELIAWLSKRSLH